VDVVAEKNKYVKEIHFLHKDRNFYASNWLFAQPTHVDIGP